MGLSQGSRVVGPTSWAAASVISCSGRGRAGRVVGCSPGGRAPAAALWSVVAALCVSLGCGPAAAPPAQAEPAAQAPVIFPGGIGEGGARPQAGWLGAELSLAAATQPGVRVAGVLPRSPAARGGLLANDLILSIDGVAVQRPDDLVSRIVAAGAGARLALAVRRAGQDRLLRVVLGARPADDQLVEQAYVGAPAPDFSGLVGVQGKLPQSIGGYKGRVLLLEFWADWCMVCRMLVPTMKQWHERWAGQGVEILAVTTDSLEVAVRSSMEQELPYPVAADQHGKTSVAYHAYGLPTVFLIDQRGVVRDLMVGLDPRKIAELERGVERLLAAPPAAEPRAAEPRAANPGLSPGGAP